MTRRGTIPQLKKNPWECVSCAGPWSGKPQECPSAPSTQLNRATCPLLHGDIHPQGLAMPTGALPGVTSHGFPPRSYLLALGCPTSHQAQVGIQLLKVLEKSNTSSPSLHPSGLICSQSQQEWKEFSGALTGITLSRQMLKFFFWLALSFFKATLVSPMNSLWPNLSSSHTEILEGKEGKGSKNQAGAVPDSRAKPTPAGALLGGGKGKKAPPNPPLVWISSKSIKSNQPPNF